MFPCLSAAVVLSTLPTHNSHPETFSDGMFSWFPIYFPIKTPQLIRKGDKVTASFWRVEGGGKVCDANNKNMQDCISNSALHNNKKTPQKQTNKQNRFGTSGAHPPRTLPPCTTPTAAATGSAFRPLASSFLSCPHRSHTNESVEKGCEKPKSNHTAHPSPSPLSPSDIQKNPTTTAPPPQLPSTRCKMHDGNSPQGGVGRTMTTSGSAVVAAAALPLKLKKASGRFLASRSADDPTVWRGLAAPVHRISARALWSDKPLSDEGATMDEKEEAELSKILREAQVWKNQAALDALPEQLREGLRLTASGVIQWKVKLKCVLKIAKARRALFSLKIHDKLSEAMLQESPLFARWPPHDLSRLLQYFSPRMADAGEYLFYMGENRDSGVVVLLQGTVKEVQKRDSKMVVLATHSASSPKTVRFYGDLVQLTDERHPCSAISTTPCETWVLPHQYIMEQFASFSEEKKADIYEAVFDEKSKILSTQLPVTPELLRGTSPVFREGTRSELDAVITKLVPKIVQKGQLIFSQGKPPTCCYILRGGTVRLVTRSALVDGTTDLSSRCIAAVAALGELEMMFKERLRTTAYAETHCYLYVLNLTDFLAMGTFASKAAKAATTRRKEVMDRSMVPKCVGRCPLFAHLHADLVAALAALFDPVVHAASELIASTSEEVNSVILVSRGHVRVLDIDAARHPKEGRVYPGECIGYTGLVPQRWTHTILATTVVESWVLPFATFRRFLRRVELHDDVLVRTRAMLADQGAGGGGSGAGTSPRLAGGSCGSDGDLHEDPARVGQGLWRRVALSVPSVRITKSAGRRRAKAEAQADGVAGARKPSLLPRVDGAETQSTVQALCETFAVKNSQLRDLCDQEARVKRRVPSNISCTRELLPAQVLARHANLKVAERRANNSKPATDAAAAAAAAATADDTAGTAAAVSDAAPPAPAPAALGVVRTAAAALVPQHPDSSAAFAPVPPKNPSEPRRQKRRRQRPRTALPTALDELCRVDEPAWQLFEQWVAKKAQSNATPRVAARLHAAPPHAHHGLYRS